MSCAAPRLDRMARRDRSPSLAEVAYRHLRTEYGDGLAGTLKATKKASEAVTTAACLAIAASKGAGRDGWPTQAEYASWWRISERQAQREWQLFKLAFPTEHDGPDRIARWLLAEYASRLAKGERGDPSVALSAPSTALLAGA